MGGLVLNTHSKGTCIGEYCTIHNFSDHHMVKWKQLWDENNARMMRICKHNIAHVDPDEITRNLKHHCDGCCDPSSQFSDDVQELTKEYKGSDYASPTSVGPISTGAHMHVPSTPPESSGFLSDEILIKLNSLSIRKPHKGVDIK